MFGSWKLKMAKHISFSLIPFFYSIVTLQIHLINSLILTDTGSQKAGYAMYVWTRGFDSTVPGCDEFEFMRWDESNHRCFTHTWDTPSKRHWLWTTCNLPGREISTIFLSDVHHKLKTAYDAKTCHNGDIELIRKTLDEGHRIVTDLKIYALFAVSDLAVSEQHLVKYVVWYNDNCTHSINERFDGVAVNNEAYASIKCGDDAVRLQYVDNLQKVKDEALKQMNGNLATHYSVSWHWGQCHGGSNQITWKGTTKGVVQHMIDIFDSIDVQVGYTIFPQISDRLKTGAYSYAISKGKDVYATFYTNKETPCQITFFPQQCHLSGRSEQGMFDIFDKFVQYGIGQVKPCIHYFRGIYSSGGHRDWPSHK